MIDYKACLSIGPENNSNTHLNLTQKDISGGRISKIEIDSIKNYPDITGISISGLKQDTFEYFIQTYGSQFKIIRFWKCPLVEDLSYLSELRQIEIITWYWNQRVNKFWDLSGNNNLKGIALSDFSRLHSFSGIEKGEALEAFSFGDAVWTKAIIDSLEPLYNCKSLSWLRIDVKKIIDNKIEPISRIPKLTYIDFPKNQFITEQVAWLKARLPPSISSNVLAPFFKKAQGLILGNKELNTIIIGKGKPFLNWDLDKRRIEKYITEFDSLVQKYKNDITIPEPNVKITKRRKSL